MLAFIFPGQGSQYPGMGQQIVEAFDEARQVFDEADEALGFSLSQLCFKGSKEDLSLTENTQPAILTTSIALYRVLESMGKRPDFVAGHSLGEYSALVAAGSLSFSDAVRLVRERGRLMQMAVPVGEGAMSAILGLQLNEVKEICQQAAQGEVVSPANVNSPAQIVIAGHQEAVARADILAQKCGAKRVLPLAVSAPFHCELMKPAEIGLAKLLRQTNLDNLAFPLVNNVEAQVVTSGEEARNGLIKQVSSAVLWTSCVQVLVEAGVSKFVEVGPGKILSGLVKKIIPSVETTTIENLEQLKSYV